ncbi:hypothetical protein RhiTH_008759 [Rhizoctonia solani]
MSGSRPCGSVPTPTPTATTTAGSDADGPVVTDAPRLVPLDLEMQRRRRRTVKRQNFPDSCGNVGNDVLSCYPTEGMTVVQGSWTRFGTLGIQSTLAMATWTSISSMLTRGLEAFKWSNVPNDSNWVGVSVNDSFWGTRGVTGWRDGQNQSMPFYFIATDAGAALDGGEPRQATFTAIQTKLPDYYYSSLSSAASVSSAMSASSLSAIASASSAAATASATPGAGSNGTGSLQNGGGDSSFPKWAIALLVILGILALAALMLLAWFSARNLRTRQRRRQSTGSSTPIMGLPASQAPPESTISPIEHPPASIVGRPVSIRRGGSLVNANVNDGASTRSGETGPISGQDAAIMASAFRAMLRKPDFASRPEEEDESPEERNVRDMKEQLAEEGRDIQSVRSERGVRVHNTAEDGSEDGWGRPTTPRR